MLNVINLTKEVKKEYRLKDTEVEAIASIPDKNQVLYRVAISEDGFNDYVIIGDANGPPDGAVMMFSVQGVLALNPNLKIEKLT